MRYIGRLKRRSEFLATASARRKNVTPGVIAQVRHRDDSLSHVRFGFTASRKVGNAVIRNKARRRLKELVRGLPESMLARFYGCDIVLIARDTTAQCDFALLRSNLLSALESLSRKQAVTR